MQTTAGYDVRGRHVCTRMRARHIKRDVMRQRTKSLKHISPYTVHGQRLVASLSGRSGGVIAIIDGRSRRGVNSRR